MEKVEKEKQYRDEYDKYRALNKQKSEIEAQMDAIKEKVAILLHEDKANEMIVPLSDGEKWKAAYQTTSRNVTDLKMLMEMVGPSRYTEVVSQKESTFLTIRKAGKEKKDSSLLNAKPVEDTDAMPGIPTGTVLS